MANCVIYARYSPGAKQTYQSIEGQLTVCKKFCKDNHLQVVGVYYDEHQTGTNDNRPEFQRMIKDSHKGKWEFVIVYAIDRFGRNRMEIAINRYKFKQNGVKVLSATQKTSENVDGTKNLDGIILEGFYESYAEYYSEELSQKVKRGRKESLAKGQALGGISPYGYIIEDKFFKIEPQQAEVVKRVFKMYADNSAIDAIILALNNDGVRNAKGKYFVKNSLLNMLKNQKYIGKFKDNNVIYDNIIPAIIDNHTWERVADRLMKNKKAPARARAKENYILSGKLYCGHCNTLMWGESGTSHTGTVYNYYKCNNSKNFKGCNKKSVSKQVIEDDIIYAIVELLEDDAQLEIIAKSVVELNNKEQQSELKENTYTKQIKEIDKSVNNIIKSIEMGAFNITLKTRLEELEQNKLELELSLEKELAYKQLDFSEDEILFWLHSFKNGDANDLEFRQRLIDSFVNAIFVYDDKTIVTFNIKDGGGKNGLKSKEILTASEGKGSCIAPTEPPKN